MDMSIDETRSHHEAFCVDLMGSFNIILSDDFYSAISYTDISCCIIHGLWVHDPAF